MNLGKSVLTATLAICTTGCLSLQSFTKTSGTNFRSEYFRTIRTAQVTADSGKYARVDSLFSAYAKQYSGTQEAKEVEFWRAMYRIDPSNKNSNMVEAIAALDHYIASDDAWWYRREAIVLRRTAQALLAARANSGVTIVTRDTVKVYSSREEEITALREQLAKANAELERIKKRLANPGT